MTLIVRTTVIVAVIMMPHRWAPQHGKTAMLTQAQLLELLRCRSLRRLAATHPIAIEEGPEHLPRAHSLSQQVRSQSLAAAKAQRFS